MSEEVIVENETTEEVVDTEETVEETTEAEDKTDDIEDIVDLSGDDDDDEVEHNGAVDLNDMRKVIQEELNKRNSNKAVEKDEKGDSKDDGVTKDDLLAMAKMLVDKQEADKQAQVTIAESNEVANKYLEDFQAQVEKAGIDPESAQGKMLLDYGVERFANLALQARLQGGKQYLPPKEVKKVMKAHWAELKPRVKALRGKGGEDTEVKENLGSPAGMATTPTTVPKKSEVEAKIKAYQEKQKTGEVMSAMEINDMQNLIKLLKAK